MTDAARKLLAAPMLAAMLAVLAPPAAPEEAAAADHTTRESVLQSMADAHAAAAAMMDCDALRRAVRGLDPKARELDPAWPGRKRSYPELEQPLHVVKDSTLFRSMPRR